MATYTYVTDATREAVLAHVVAVQNATRKDQGADPINAGAFLAAQLDGIIDGWAERAKREFQRAVLDQFNSLPSSQQAKLMGVAPEKLMAAATTAAG